MAALRAYPSCSRQKVAAMDAPAACSDRWRAYADRTSGRPAEIGPEGPPTCVSALGSVPLVRAADLLAHLVPFVVGDVDQPGVEVAAGGERLGAVAGDGLAGEIIAAV